MLVDRKEAPRLVPVDSSKSGEEHGNFRPASRRRRHNFLAGLRLHIGFVTISTQGGMDASALDGHWLEHLCVTVVCRFSFWVSPSAPS